MLSVAKALIRRHAALARSCTCPQSCAAGPCIVHNLLVQPVSSSAALSVAVYDMPLGATDNSGDRKQHQHTYSTGQRRHRQKLLIILTQNVQHVLLWHYPPRQTRVCHLKKKLLPHSAVACLAAVLTWLEWHSLASLACSSSQSSPAGNMLIKVPCSGYNQFPQVLLLAATN